MMHAGPLAATRWPSRGPLAKFVRAMPAPWLTGGRVAMCEHPYDALEGVDALALVTDWKPFRHPDFAAMKMRMKQAVIVDGRNQYDPKQVRAEGFEYARITAAARAKVAAGISS